MTEDENKKSGISINKMNLSERLGKLKLKSVKKKKIKYWLRKNWMKSLPTIFMLVTIIVSLRACNIAENANKLSQKAIDTNTEQFFQENKPYIILKPIKYSELQSYYKYESLSEHNAVNMEFKFQIKNIGKAAAKELAVFRGVKSPLIPKHLAWPLPTVLGPGQEHFLTIETTMEFKNKESYEEYVQKLSSEKGQEVTIRMGVTYLSEFNPEQSFISAVVTKLTKQRAQIVKMEYEDEEHLTGVENR
jgi:hypothetical protein